MTMLTKEINTRTKRYREYSEGIIALLAGLLVLVLVYAQFRGDFTSRTQLTMLSSRAGLVMDAGSKVTYNGVQIGSVASVSEVQWNRMPAAKLVLSVCRNEWNMTQRPRSSLPVAMPALARSSRNSTIVGSRLNTRTADDTRSGFADRNAATRSARRNSTARRLFFVVEAGASMNGFGASR